MRKAKEWKSFDKQTTAKAEKRVKELKYLDSPKAYKKTAEWASAPYWNDREVVGGRIKAQRKANGIKSQEALAEKLSEVLERYDEEGISNYHTIGSWERGSTLPTVHQFFAMAELFGCTLDYLLGRSARPEQTEAEYRSAIQAAMREQDEQCKVARRDMLLAYLNATAFCNVEITENPFAPGKYRIIHKEGLFEDHPLGCIDVNTAELDILCDYIDQSITIACRNYILWTRMHDEREENNGQHKTTK